MRQVPTRYLIIGNGRLARHMYHYLTLLQLPVNLWHRSQNLNDLAEKLALATHVLVLISDSAIEPFIDSHLQTTSALIMHCSGSLISKAAYGVHPLMTFGPHLYEEAQYARIPFIIDEDAPCFADLLPGVPNPYQRLSKSLKAKYHALCVLSGNFTCMLWQKLFVAFKDELKISPELAYPYLEQQIQNLLIDPEKALTGPISRGDHVTIAKNIAALAGDPFQEVYRSFVNCHAVDCAQKLEGEEL